MRVYYYRVTHEDLNYVEANGIISSRCYEIEGNSFMCAPRDIDEHTSYEEPLASISSNQLSAIMRDEMSFITRNQV